MAQELETPVQPTPESQAGAPVAASTADVTAQASAVSSPSTDSTPAPSPSWRDQLREAGVDLGTDDDKAAFTNLAQAWNHAKQFQQVQPYLPYVQSYISDAADYSEWKRSRQQQQAPAPQDQPWYSEYWNPPEFDQSWRQLITQDAQGNIIPAQGAPPDIVPKYHTYTSWRQQQADKLMSNPYTFLEPAIRRLASEEAQKIAQQQLSSYQDQLSSQQFVEQHAPWLYEKDERGGIKQEMVWDAQRGQHIPTRKLSEWGHKFRAAAGREAERQHRYGYQDLEEQKRNAMQAISLEFALSELQRLQPGAAPAQAAAPAAPAAPPVSPLQQSNEAFLKQSSGRGRPPQNGNSVPAPKPPVTRHNLKQVLEQRIAAIGA